MHCQVASRQLGSFLDKLQHISHLELNEIPDVLASPPPPMRPI